jgi:hypothetical protein
MVQMELPAGPHDLEVVVHGLDGAEIERLPLTIEAPESGITFARVRSFR